MELARLSLTNEVFGDFSCDSSKMSEIELLWLVLAIVVIKLPVSSTTVLAAMISGDDEGLRTGDIESTSTIFFVSSALLECS